MHHEICGHGFGKLADEYESSYASTFKTVWWNDVATRHNVGIFRNVDKYITDNFNSLYSTSFDLTQASEVLWYDMLSTTNDYVTNEGLGIYEGGYTYNIGFCRPTEAKSASIMNGNTGIFNAISRRQMYYRWRWLSGDLTTNCFGTEAELNAFLEWDRQYVMPNIYSVSTKVETKASCVEQEVLPCPPPSYAEGWWEGTRFHRL